MSVYITFDTERDWDRVLGLSSIDYISKSFDMIERAIPKLLDIAEEYSIPYTFFICGEVAENVPFLFDGLSSNHSIGVHTHPFTHSDIFKGRNPNDHEYDLIENYEYNEQFNMISRDMNSISDNIGIKSDIFRGGKHSANLITFKVLEKLKFKIDSSINSGYQLLGWSPFKIENIGLWELPAYCDASPETIHLLNSLFRYSSYIENFGIGQYVVVFHPMAFGNPRINFDKTFVEYEKFINNLIKIGYNFSSINNSIFKNYRTRKYYNILGKMFSTLCYPIYQTIRKHGNSISKINEATVHESYNNGSR